MRGEVGSREVAVSWSARARRVIALAAAAAALSGYVPASAQTSPFSTNKCGRNAARCWYVVFGVGDAPTRKAYFADFSVTPMADGIVQINALAVHEDTSSLDHYAATLEFDCAKHRYRSVGAYAFEAGGRIVPEPPTRWNVVPKSWVERIELAACEPKARDNPNRYDMLHLGNLFRPIDVAELTRRFMWAPQPAKAP